MLAAFLVGSDLIGCPDVEIINLNSQLSSTGKLLGTNCKEIKKIKVSLSFVYPFLVEQNRFFLLSKTDVFVKQIVYDRVSV